MRHWQNLYPPYEGEEEYIYFAFAEKDIKKVWRIMRILLMRGCRVWYAIGAAGNADELKRRQKRALDAALTIVYISAAVCKDEDTKGRVMVNQKNDCKIIGLESEHENWRLDMNLRENTPFIPLYNYRNNNDLEDALVHSKGFAQKLFGEPVIPPSEMPFGVKMLITLGVVVVLAFMVLFIGNRYLGWFRDDEHNELLAGLNGDVKDGISVEYQKKAEDEVLFSDSVIEEAVRYESINGVITKKLTEELVRLRFEELPGSYKDLELLPALETIEIPQKELIAGGELPEGDYTIVLIGGDSG